MPKEGRKLSREAFIYALLDPNGDVRYVGKSVDPVGRLQHHQRDKSSVRKVQWIRLLKKSGKTPTIIILEKCDADNWQESERRWIARFRDFGANLTNHTDGGEGLSGLSEDSRNKLRRAQQDIWSNPETSARMLTILRSPERRAKISAALTGKIKSADHVAKLPQNQKGFKHSAEFAAKQRKHLLTICHLGMRGKKHSATTKAVLAEKSRGNTYTRGRVMPHWERIRRSRTQQGRRHSIEHRMKIAEAQRRAWARRKGQEP